jgi:hypothetical protein
MKPLRKGPFYQRMMTTYIAGEFANKKSFGADFGYAILKMRAGFGWPFRMTG